MPVVMAPRLAPRPHFFFASGMAALATLAFAALVQFEPGGAGATLYVTDVGTVAAALLATVLCVLAVRPRHGLERLFWLLLAVGCGAWTAAEATWAIYELVLREDLPVPSLADVGYLAGTVLVLVALVLHPALHGGRARRTRSLLDGALGATALLFLSWTFVLGPLWRHTDLSMLGGLVALAYPFADVMMILLVVMIVRRLENGDRLHMFCLLNGLIAMSVADSGYAYLVQSTGYDGGLLDVGWFAGYLGIALGALASRPQLAPVKEPSGAPHLSPLVVPLFPILLAEAVIAVEIKAGKTLDTPALVMAAGIVFLALVRYLLVVRDVRQPAGGRLFSRLSNALLGYSPDRHRRVV